MTMAGEANPNEYDDEKYSKGVNDLQDAVWWLWEAGASEDEIRSEFKNALANIEH